LPSREYYIIFPQGLTTPVCITGAKYSFTRSGDFYWTIQYYYYRGTDCILLKDRLDDIITMLKYEHVSIYAVVNIYRGASQYMKKAYTSKNVIRRLPRYLRKLDELIEANVERISSGELGPQMGLTPSQIRQDFSCFGEFGQQGYGYNVKALRNHIATILGIDRAYSVILVGAGKIGQSLIENINFGRYDFRFMGAFDIRKEMVGREIAGVPIMDAETQDAFIRDNNVDIAILSVNRDRAQHVANLLIDSGIHAIWNFTDIEIDAGNSGVVVENMHFSDSLLALSYFLSSKGE